MASSELEKSLVGGAIYNACAVDENAPFSMVESFDEELTAEEIESIGSVLVVGNGCRLCHELFRETLQATSMLGIPTYVEHVTAPDVAKLYGVKRNPALIINEKIVCEGLRLHASEIASVIIGFVKHGKTLRGQNKSN